MPMPIPSLLAVALGAITVTPPTVPAKGSQQVIVTVDKTSMVRLTTVNPAGTSCEVIDHLRGPFVSSGQPGKTNCDLDLLLDAGVYKVRLRSPAKGKGTVTLKAEAFKEVNSPLLRLERGRSFDEVLKPHQQASFWLHVEGRQFVPLRVSGRTAGEVRLWKSGEWSESVDARPRSASPLPGKPIHEWWIARTLEAGDYLLTVYGTNPQKWTRGPEDDLLSVAYLFDPMPADGLAEATIPPWGVLSWSLPKRMSMVNLQLFASPATPVELELRGGGGDGTPIDSVQAGCRIEAKAQRYECTTTSGDLATAVMVRGAPGTRVRLESGRYDPSGGLLLDGEYGRVSSGLAFKPATSGPHLVAMSDLPPNPDAPPLGCVLRRAGGDGTWELIARDVFQVGAKKTLERAFNYEGGELPIWFEVTSGSGFTLGTSGQRKSYCELYRVDEAGARQRLSESTPEPGCKLEKSLAPGFYELKLFGGNAGIETIKIADSNKSWFGSNVLEKASADKTGCVFPSVRLEAGAHYRIETSRDGTSARGLALRPLPLALDRPLAFEVAPGRTVEVPVAAGKALALATESPVSCTLGKNASAESKDGACRLPASAAQETLTVSNKGARPVAVRLARQVPPPPQPPLVAYNPTFAPLPALGLDAPVHFDFARQEQRSLVFDVKDAGLYHLSTVGLLATDCQIRTPAAPGLAQDRGGGRGRNCLVAGYLRPGRYLATVQTVGQSRGRGGVVLSKRPSRPGPDTAIDSTVFYKTDSDTLLTQKLLVPKGGRATLETLARGASLSCRLEDKDGWPVERVPTACSLTREFEAGQYLWVQLPLTVESMRRTRFEKIRPPVVLSGKKAYEVGFNTWYQAKLGKSGKDEFVFDVPAGLEIQLVVTDAMQGRLYKVDAAGAATPVEFIAPQSVPPPAPDEEGVPSDDGGEGYSEPPSSDYGGEGEDMPPDGEGMASGEGEGEYVPPAPSYTPPKPSLRVDLPSGQALSLEQGKYKFIAEHSRADVAVSYRLYLRSDDLAPGIARDVVAPGHLAVHVPSDGILRLRSRGESDVRCRLFDQDGRLVAESGSVGDDWNCAFAEPIVAGTYDLAIESEALDPVITHVGVAMPRAETAAALAEGQTLKLGTTVTVAPVPEAQGDVVQEVTLSSAGAAFSCDVSGAQGVIARRGGVKTCAFLVRAKGEKLTVRAWLVERVPSGPVAVQVHVAAKPIGPAGSSIDAKAAVAAPIARDGRYQTSEGVYCLPETAKGVLEPCGPEISLEKGTVVFAALGAKGAKLPLDEVRFDASEKAAAARLKLDARPFIQASRASGSLHLLRVTGLSGEGSAPTCGVAGGARVVRDTDCFAASGLTDEAVARAWIAGEPGEVEIARQATKLPREPIALFAGQQSLTWPNAPARLLPPAQPARVELTLPPETWAVQLDSAGRAVDLCPPEKDVARCVFATRGGELAIVGEGERRADATVVLGETPAKARLTAGLFEAAPRVPGFLTVEVPPSASARRLEVEGARYCSVRFADGNRAAGCTAALPANLGAEVLLAHDGRPVRASAQGAASPLDALFPLASSMPKDGPPLAMAQGVPLVGGWVGRSLTLDKAAVVHLRGDSGVCGLSQKGHVFAADGLGAGCALDRLLEPGTYQLFVRPFGGQPLTGAVAWTLTQVETLAEGVGPERWLTPGQARLFRFTLASAGRVGIGLQEPAETLACAVRDAAQGAVGEGCQQFLKLDAGSFLLEIRAPAGARPTRFRPVVVGLQGAKMDVPESYLRDFFQRIGGVP